MAAEVWAGAADTYRSQIVGPHFESLCRRWVDRYAGDETLGGSVAPARRLQVNDRNRRQSFELDVAARILTARCWQSPPDDGAAARRGQRHLVSTPRLLPASTA